jgi:hypothetical protein
MPINESRTRERALGELLRLLPSVREEIPDPDVRALLSEDLVREVFKTAWDQQFDDDRAAAGRALRQVIREKLADLEES